MVSVYTELLELRPDDADLARDARSLRQDLKLPVDEVVEEVPELSDKDREAIREAMGQADLYLQQGLVRVARRLLENLRFRYPEDPQIVRKIAVIDEVRTHLDENEIRRRVEKTTVLEAQYKERLSGKKAEARKAEAPKVEPMEPAATVWPDAAAVSKAPPKPKPAAPFKAEVLEGEKISTADIFAETDIVPFVGEVGARLYYDLGQEAAEALGWLASARGLQTGGEAPPVERELDAIVAQFRNDLKDKDAVSDPSTHYELGLAYMGQGLMAEAVEEMTEAAKDPHLAAECYSALSEAFKQRGDVAEAQKWAEKAK
jgi:tetratricopeptide (TPR) repeat protein